MGSIYCRYVSPRARMNANEVKDGSEKETGPRMMPTFSDLLSFVFRKQQVEHCSQDWRTTFSVTVPR